MIQRYECTSYEIPTRQDLSTLDGDRVVARERENDMITLKFVDLRNKHNIQIKAKTMITVSTQ